MLFHNHRLGLDKRIPMLGTVFWVCFLLPIWVVGQDTDRSALPWDRFEEGQVPFRWQVSKPVLELDLERFPPTEKPWLAIKDPTIVRYDSQWHLFCTIRRGGDQDGRIRIGYCHFGDWKDAQAANWTLLDLTLGYHGAPQIFYFEPQQKWYLIYQAEDPERGLKYGPCFSTNSRLDDPEGWTRPEPLYEVPEGTNAGLDFWVICDEAKAHLFFTTLNGKMWRCETDLEQFPAKGWSKPQVVLEGDIFEASHTYKIHGHDRFVTFIEAQNGGRRYFKVYQAERLDGQWTALADSKSVPFVSPQNVVNQDESWSTSYSHGELIRSGVDQRLEVPAKQWQLLFQGVDDAGRRNRSYGQIPWKLGVLKQEPFQLKADDEKAPR